MEFIFLAALNAGVWALAYNHHQKANSAARVYDRGLGDQSNPGLGVNETYNPETNKLFTGTVRTRQQELEYKRRLQKRPVAANHVKLDHFRKKSNAAISMHSGRMQAVGRPVGKCQYEDPFPGGKGRVMQGIHVTVSQMPVKVG